MSSILDALNKLEQEKASRIAEAAGKVVSTSPEEAAAELLGDNAFSSSLTLTSHSCVPVVAALIVGALLTTLTVVVTLWLVATPGQTVIAAPAPAVEQEAPLVHTYTVPLKAEVETVEAVPAPPQEPEPAPVAAAKAPVVTPQETPKPKAKPLPPEPVKVPEPAVLPPVSQAEPITAVPKPEPVAPPPTPVPPVVVPEPAPVVAAQEFPPTPPAPLVVETPMAEPEQHPLPDAAALMRQQELASPPPAATAGDGIVLAQATAPSRAPVFAVPPAARADSGPVDMNALPRLSTQEREDLGLDNIRLNVLRPADKDQPDALAIINLKKVYVGEMIPGTSARLIAVESGAIGVEVDSGGSQKRFRIPR